MTKLEKLADEYCTKMRSDVNSSGHSVPRAYALGFIAGFKEARQMAESLWREIPDHRFEKAVREMGEEE